MTVAIAKAANMTVLCPGLGASEVAAEHAALIAAAEYHANDPNSFHDIGCKRTSKALSSAVRSFG